MLFMTDDCNTEKCAVKSIGANATQFLCIFHLFQRRWIWLYEGKNKVQQQDRVTLINKVKTLVYAKSEVSLLKKYEDFCTNKEVKKYPLSFWHIFNLCGYVALSGLCVIDLSFSVRGNTTNDLSEAGVRILKEFLFSST